MRTPYRPSRASTTHNLLALDSWRYEDFFSPLEAGTHHSVIDEIEEYVERRALECHPFFGLAREHKEALDLWASQELVMTNAFSQIVLQVAAQVTNVHVRSVLVDVAAGEHCRPRNGVATQAHPWLLHRLAASINLSPHAVRPLKPTTDFIDRMVSGLDSIWGALAYIGVGNERLILPEYSAIKRCFDAHHGAADYEPFLQANLSEDETHTALCYSLVSAMIQTAEDEREFRIAAISSVDSRFRYFDELAQLVPV